ncbi:hypothetical protein B0I72DRAFT_134731 [Yarrowia lipolytica]|uniref:Uncharacterized protein n=1 Tax=Yarrowia lipolytica TaxID=4952 RepID=A0A371CBN3_YARLL|nr:hypothetical protein BKA91DRAFT_133374 [Yarrowia lipolytica]KAE8175283.1 hypothetical protein BKA90DRAFT_132396 [Yarrowia lipolytica]RDW27510.1 hypothetical protein B0I71DRAFT_128906 [Yarrowia lipolytica]RDW34395.1 hypothetical protein B0I72DRAFT_134731 [Yarrowia lipolytica]RMI98743.1 hypothetical protein BD777DRAFT_124956 [Yarrowia lipolytica]
MIPEGSILMVASNSIVSVFLIELLVVSKLHIHDFDVLACALALATILVHLSRGSVKVASTLTARSCDCWQFDRP